MVIEFYLIFIISTKFTIWFYLMGFNKLYLLKTNYLALLAKLQSVSTFYTDYLFSNLQFYKRTLILNFWSSGKFADTYWFIYTKSLSTRE